MVQLVWTIPKVDMNGFYGSPGIIPIAHPNKRTNVLNFQRNTTVDQNDREKGKTISLEHNRKINREKLVDILNQSVSMRDNPNQTDFKRFDLINFRKCAAMCRHPKPKQTWPPCVYSSDVHNEVL